MQGCQHRHVVATLSFQPPFSIKSQFTVIERHAEGASNCAIQYSCSFFKFLPWLDATSKPCCHTTAWLVRMMQVVMQRNNFFDLSLHASYELWIYVWSLLFFAQSNRSIGYHPIHLMSWRRLSTRWGRNIFLNYVIVLLGCWAFSSCIFPFVVERVVV